MFKILDEEEKRKKLTEEFQKSLNNITQMMTESNAQNTKLGEENRHMAERLGNIYEEFKSRENEVDRISRQMDIERQLAEAQTAELKTEFLIEKQKLLAENEALSLKVASLTKELSEATQKCELLGTRVVEMTTEIDKCSVRYGEFENTITQNWKTYDQCKAEMNKIMKKVKAKLEKEVIEWQTRYHQTANAMYEVQIESNEKSRLIGDVTKKMNQLTKLCRQLEVERKAYMNTLRELGKDPKDIVVEEPAADPAVDELIKPIIAKTASLEIDDGKLGAKPKPILKAKRGKNKGKKIKDASVPSTSYMTPKEIKLAEMKRELKEVEALMKLQMESTSSGSVDDDAKNNDTEEGFVLEAAGDGVGLVCTSQPLSVAKLAVQEPVENEGNALHVSDDSLDDSLDTLTEDNPEPVNGQKNVADSTSPSDGNSETKKDV